jgi:SAM-dependent methyltransferase
VLEQPITASPAPGAAPRLPPCLYCGGEAYSRLFAGVHDRLGYVPGTWEYWRCGGCGSAMLAPFPRLEDLPAFYPPVYGFVPEMGQESTLKRTLAGLEYRFFFKPQYAAQVRRILRGAPGLPPRPRLLDVGCGRGLRLLAFRDRGCDVHGLDFQPEVVDYVQKHFGIPVACAGVENLDRHFAPASFDLVTAFYVVEHVVDVAEVLRTCFRLLRPGGWFVAAVPMVDSVQARVFRSHWMNVTEAPRHVSLPSHRGLHEVCARVGYDRVSIQPDSTLTCAGIIGLSVFPQAATTAVYGGSRARAVANRLLGGLVALTAVPWVLAENYLIRRPAHGMVFAHKPGEPSAAAGA